MISLLPPAAGQSRQAGDRDINYSINLDENAVSVDVSNPSGGYIVISGNVSLTRASDVAVHLSSYVISNPWESTVEPETLYFTSGGPSQMQFVVNLQVPHGVPKDVSDIIQVNGSWDILGIGGTIPPDQCVINIQQFSAIVMTAEDPAKPYIDYPDKDAILEFPIAFENTGNGDDLFELLCSGIEEVEDFGLGDTIELKTSEEKTRTLLLDLPDTENLQEYTLTLTATSRRSGYFNSVEIHVYVYEGRAFVALTIDPLLIIRKDFNLGTVNIDPFRIDGEREITVSVAAYIGTVENIELRLESDDGFRIENDPGQFTLYPGDRQTFTLTISYEQTNKSLRDLPNRLILLRAEGKSDGGKRIDSNQLRFITAIRPPSTGKSDSPLSNPYTAPVAGATAAVVIGIISVATYASSETGKYKLLGLLFVPLYTKLHKDKILDHFARGRLYEYIKLNPGVTFTALKSEVDLGNGTLTYHLRTLEREELIKSTKEGRNRCFYITGTKVAKPGIGDDILDALKGVDKKIYSLIMDKPGISQIEIFKVLKQETNLAQRTVSNHIKMMERRGLIEMKRDGKDKRCYLADAAEPAS